MTELRRMIIKSEEQRLVYGEVYSPLVLDTDGETMTAQEIAKAEQYFRSQEGWNEKIDVQHDLKESGCQVVRSFIALKNDPDGFIEGAWVMGVIVHPDDLWEQVKKGELNGFSFHGEAIAQTIEALVNQMHRIVGKTETNTDDLIPPHEHPVCIEFDEDGKVIPTKTDKVFDHEHPILRTTATEMDTGHAHRLIIVEQEDS